MKKRTKRLVGGLAVTAGLFAAARTYWKKKGMSKETTSRKPADVWARPGMQVTFRAEVMPGRERDERTFRVKKLLPSGRVLLDRVEGEHAAKEFEAVN